MKKLLVLLVCIGLIGCGSGSGGSNTGNASGNGEDNSGDTSNQDTVSGSTLTFDLSDAVAVLKADESAAQVIKATVSDSNLLKLTTSGTIDNVFTGGEAARVSELYIAPDGKLYVVFSSPVNVEDQPCILIRLGRDNTGQCIDDELMTISTFPVPTKPIQFDDAGNIYYAGNSSDGKGVLRKKSPDLTDGTDILNDNVQLSRFLVKGNGTVYIAGTNIPTDTRFFRRILTSGSIENLLSGADIQSLYELPDSNVYAGDWGARFGVLKVTDEGVSDSLYIGSAPHPSDFYIDAYCDGDSANPGDDRWRYWGLCGFSGTMLSYYYRSIDDNVYVVAGWSGDSATLWKYWPEIKPIDTSVLRPTIVNGTLATLLIAGYDQSGKNKLIAYNTTDKSEIDLLNGEDIELYHFSYSAGSGLIIFDGLRFSDNAYIVGSIDTQNENALTVLESGIRYEDVQFFE